MIRRRRKTKIRYDAHGRPIVTSTARYPRKCVECSEPIRPGEQIRWTVGERRSPVHERCADDEGQGYP